MKPIAYYITAHGYGHGTRSCDVLRALHRLAPDQPVIVVTDLPRDFLDSRLAGCTNLTFRQASFDVGLIQMDSLRADLFQTLEKLEALYANEEELIADERRFLKQEKVCLVVADIPAIPLAAAQRAKITNIAVGNFSWDWIYEAYAKQDLHWEFFVDKFRRVYEQTDLLLRLPFSPPMEEFPTRKDMPLLASAGQDRRADVAELYNVDPEKTWVLLSFTSLDLRAEALANIRTNTDTHEFFCVEPLEYPMSCIHSVQRCDISFPDILATCDVVISKPGFGLVSECLVNRKPLIYSDRGDFAEYPYLVAGIERYLQHVFLPSDKLYAGDFADALEEIKTSRKPTQSMKEGGAEQIARELIARRGSAS